MELGRVRDISRKGTGKRTRFIMLLFRVIVVFGWRMMGTVSVGCVWGLVRIV